MGKISTVISTSTVKSPNLELSASMLENNPSSHKRKVSDQFPKEKSIKVFKRLIIITTVVFSFGGLGFGFALRYSNIFQIHQSNNVPFTNFSD